MALTRYRFFSRELRGINPQTLVDATPSLVAYRQRLAASFGPPPERYDAFLRRFLVHALDAVEEQFASRLDGRIETVVRLRGEIQATYQSLLNPATLAGKTDVQLRQDRLDLEQRFRDLEEATEALRTDIEGFHAGDYVPPPDAPLHGDTAALADEYAYADDPETGDLYVPRPERAAPEDVPHEAEPTLDLDDPLDPNLFTRALDNEDLPDISDQFTYNETVRPDGFREVEVSGELGVPGEVRTHRDEGAQSAISSGTGDHAAHLVANIFGASGGPENLSAFNWGTNLSSYKRLENHWGRLLLAGGEVSVRVTDVFPPGAGDRPRSREVRWTETAPDGSVSQQELTFPNFHTPESRAARGL